MTAPIVAIGECMLELSVGRRSGLQLAHAGDTFNTCVYLSRLGLNVAYLTALGVDPFSAEMRAGWEAEGLDSSLVLTDPDRLPGLYAIRTDRFGERSFFYWREASAVRTLFDLPGVDAALAAAARAKLVYLSGITLSLFGQAGRDRLVELCSTVRASGGQVAFDPNYRPRGWPSARAASDAIGTIAPLVSIALPTFEDEAALHGDQAPDATIARWLSVGAREVVVKLGPAGCRVANVGGAASVPAAAHVMAVDTTGAGDAFNAGYLASRWHGRTREASAAFGNTLAAEVVRYPGAIIPRDLTPRLFLPAELSGDCA